MTPKGFAIRNNHHMKILNEQFILKMKCFHFYKMFINIIEGILHMQKFNFSFKSKLSDFHIYYVQVFYFI